MADTSHETPRGFAGYAQFEDSYGARVRVQESSAATRRAVWIFVEGGAVGSADKPNDGSAHLDEAQARQVRDALTAFLGDEPEPEEPALTWRDYLQLSSPAVVVVALVVGVFILDGLGVIS